MFTSRETVLKGGEGTVLFKEGRVIRNVESTHQWRGQYSKD